MERTLPRLFLARHGDTAWTDSHRHTGRTDIPLNERGQEHALTLGRYLEKYEFARVFTSPLVRASKTCELAGFGSRAEVDADLVEWDYGRYEGKVTSEIVKERPGWMLYRDGCPEGESPADVAARADRFLAQIQNESGNILAFSSGHIIRMIAARWLELADFSGHAFACDPASLGVLGYEHGRRDEPFIEVWNFTGEPPK